MPPAFDAFNYIDCLPSELWEAILSHLDGGSLITFAKAVPELERIVLHARVVRALKFLPGTDERTIQDFNAANISNHVRKLDLNNCIVLPSAVLLGCASRCTSLQMLSCVNCVVEPARLFTLLATDLVQVRVLEWSLHDQWTYEQRPIINFQSPSTSLETMYVEAEGSQPSVSLLTAILRLCTSLRNLHIHEIWSRYCTEELISEWCFDLFNVRPSLKTFKFTCERDLFPRELNWPILSIPSSVPSEYIIFGNVSYQLTPVSSCNLVVFDNDFRNVQLPGVSQATVAMQADAEITHRCLSKAISMPERWANVSSLCLLLLAPRAQRGWGTATASMRVIDATQRFFRLCTSGITELNLAAFHFDSDTNGCSVVGSSLPQLRALAIAPCGASHANSLTSLARGCKNLEELDIQSEFMWDWCPSPRHDCGSVPLQFSEAGFRTLHESTRLRKLSLHSNARMTSLDFLRECRVSDFSFSMLSIGPELAFTSGFELGVSRLLGLNPRLSSLTIFNPPIFLREDVFARGLAAVSSLRQLCVLFYGIYTNDQVVSFFRFMQAELPLLQLLHIHYHNDHSVEITATWLRQRHPVPGRPDVECGVVVYDQPCIGCYRRSFIGLTKPRNLL